MNCRLTLSAVVLSLAASAAVAQSAAEPVPTLTATRSIDVIASDMRGNRLRGLTQADFQIIQDAKPQEITRFAELTRDVAAPDAQPGRKIVIAFDMSSLTLAGRKRSVETTRAFVKARVRPADRVMISEVSNVGAAMPVGSWTSDPAEIEKSLATIESRGLTDKSFARRNAEQNIQLAVDFDRQSSGSSGNMITFDTLMQTARQYAGQAEAEAARTTAAIQDLLSVFGEGSGKRMIVIAGGGLSTRPGSEIFTFLEAIKQQAELGQTGPGVQRGAKQANPRAEISRYDITKDVREVGRMARNRGIVIYALDHDTSGSTQMAAERKQMADTGADFAGVADQMSGYQLLTAETGGLALLGGSAADAVARLSSDLDSHYTLTFQQTIPANGPLPRVDVRTTRPGVRVRSAFLGGPSTRDSEVQETVIANHRADPSSNDLKISLASDPAVAEGENRRVKLRVLIPVKSLTLAPNGNEVVGGFNVYISTGDAKGNSGTVNRQAHQIRWPADALPQMIDKTIGFALEVVMPPGRTQISIGVMDQRSGQTGYARLAI